MRTEELVPATTKSNSDLASSSKDGFKTYSLSLYPTRAAPIGPSNGAPVKQRDADAPIIAGISGSTDGSSDITLAIIWISFLNSFGKSGLIGLSINLDVKVSFSEGLPSRLKKPPGILPAAYVFS